jgi:Zn-dependent peptidase ImmA (M78 family)
MASHGLDVNRRLADIGHYQFVPSPREGSVDYRRLPPVFLGRRAGARDHPLRQVAGNDRVVTAGGDRRCHFTPETAPDPPAPADYDAVFRLLKRSGPKSYANILVMAKGLDKRIDPQKPWESGYELARLMRERLNIDPSARLDVEALARDLGVDVQEAAFQDESVLGVCVGTPDHTPLVVLNTFCPDASGPSGRRTTLSHELSHLLFDRGGYRHLARFEGARAVGDRLMEMPANAFAIELLVPMVNLRGVTEERLGDVAKEWQVSTHALVKHLHNYRRRGGR